MTGTATITAHQDRWELIADRLWNIPELGWAIAEANPDYAGYLILPAGLPLVIPELRSLRRPLTAANPAREDDGEFQQLPPDTPRPIVPPSGGGGSVVFPIEISQGGTGAVTAQQALANLGAVALASKGVPGGIAGLDGGAIVPAANLPPYPTLASLGGLAASAVGESVAPLIAGVVPIANLPAFQSPLTFPIAISQGGTGAATASAALSALGGIATSQRGIANGIAPLDSNSIVPIGNLPPYPTLDSLGGLAASSRNAANGVAGLEANNLILIAQIPGSVQFQLLARTNTAAGDANSITGGHGSIKWFDGTATNVNVPTFASSGALIQYDPLNVAANALYKYQIFVAYNNRIAERHQSNGTWGPWNERAYLNRVQDFLNMQNFTAGASFRGGASPANTPTLVQTSVDSNGLPRYWLVNANAPVNSRIKSITVANNGNVQIRHHNDDLSDGNVLEHTASGNILTNGTLRCGGGTANFTGATFVPGALFFRSDLGMLTYSDGTSWRRMDTNAVV